VLLWHDACHVASNLIINSWMSGGGGGLKTNAVYVDQSWRGYVWSCWPRNCSFYISACVLARARAPARVYEASLVVAFLRVSITCWVRRKRPLPSRPWLLHLSVPPSVSPSPSKTPIPRGFSQSYTWAVVLTVDSCDVGFTFLHILFGWLHVLQ